MGSWEWRAHGRMHWGWWPDLCVCVCVWCGVCMRCVGGECAVCVWGKEGLPRKSSVKKRVVAFLSITDLASMSTLSSVTYSANVIHQLLLWVSTRCIYWLMFTDLLYSWAHLAWTAGSRAFWRWCATNRKNQNNNNIKLFCNHYCWNIPWEAEISALQAMKVYGYPVVGCYRLQTIYGTAQFEFRGRAAELRLFSRLKFWTLWPFQKVIVQLWVKKPRGLSETTVL